MPLETPMALAHSSGVRRAARRASRIRTPSFLVRSVIWEEVFMLVFACSSARWAHPESEDRGPVHFGDYSRECLAAISAALAAVKPVGDGVAEQLGAELVASRLEARREQGADAGG